MKKKHVSVFVSLLLLFFTRRQALSTEENRIDIIKILLKLKLEKQKVSNYLEALEASKPDIFHARILKILVKPEFRND